MELLRFATAGSVDDGKSTLMGRLLHDTRSVLEDQLAAVERTSRARGDEYVNLAPTTGPVPMMVPARPDAADDLAEPAVDDLSDDLAEPAVDDIAEETVEVEAVEEAEAPVDDVDVETVEVADVPADEAAGDRGQTNVVELFARLRGDASDEPAVDEPAGERRPPCSFRDRAR